ncbi:MAG: thiamine pyrophosphate-binding protein [Rhodospirillales bacterium]
MPDDSTTTRPIDPLSLPKPRHAADIIARRLAEAGCKYAFGIPGGEVLRMLDALDRYDIKFILTKHENAAGFMAQATYMADGAPGILIATVGPGISNALNVVADAWQDRIPLIVITGCMDPADRVTYTHQVFDHIAVFTPVTKGAFAVVDGMIDKAVMTATDGQPGPVLIDLPVNVAEAKQPEAEPVRRARVSPAVPAGADLDTVRGWLIESEKPLLIAGVDVLTQHAAETVREFAWNFNVPVLTTYNAKGVMPEDDPLSLGAMGLSPKADEILQPFVKESDLVLLAGYDPIEMRIGWRDPWAKGARVVDIAAVANTHYVHHAALHFVGDVGESLKALGQGIKPNETWAKGRAGEARKALRTAFAAEEEWGAAAVIATAREVLPRETVTAVDTGAHRILFDQMWQAFDPRDVMQSTGLGTMGCALPLVIGRKMAEPGRPVAAFVGDACLEMIIGELATARDHKLPVILIVFVDESLALIELKQRAMQLPNLGVDFSITDFPAIAKAYGGVGIQAASRAALTKALKDALAEPEKFTLIACPIPRQNYDGKI